MKPHNFRPNTYGCIYDPKKNCLRLEAADDVDYIEELDGFLVEQYGLVGDRGVVPLLHRRQKFSAHHGAKNVLDSADQAKSNAAGFRLGPG